MRFLEIGLILNMKLNCGSYTPCILQHQDNFAQHLYCSCVHCAPSQRKSMEFSTWDVISVPKQSWILEHLGFWVFRKGLLILY